WKQKRHRNHDKREQYHACVLYAEPVVATLFAGVLEVVRNGNERKGLRLERQLQPEKRRVQDRVCAVRKACLLKCKRCSEKHESRRQTQQVSKSCKPVRAEKVP